MTTTTPIDLDAMTEQERHEWDLDLLARFWEPSTTHDELYVGTKEIAAALGISEEAARGRHCRGRLPFPSFQREAIGKCRILALRADVEKWQREAQDAR